MTDKTNLVEELPVLMINETEQQEYVKRKYFDQDQPSNERTSNFMDTNGKKQTSNPEGTIGNAGKRPCVNLSSTNHWPLDVYVHLQ